MTISYALSYVPKWYIADLVGRPLGGGSMYTYSSLDKTQFKFVYQDAAGNFPWQDPVLFDENGSQGPFYFQMNTEVPSDTYYIEIYDADGVLQWTMDNYTPPSGGGGSIITTALDLENLIVNSVMWRNIGVSQSPLPTFLKIAPGAHSALAQTTSNAGPDICFIKNNTNATDEITFIDFPLGTTPLTGDVTPAQYLNYMCTNSPSSETFKYVQYPITQNVQNLSNQNMTITIWARLHSLGGNTNLTLQWYQFFGDGVGASSAVTHPIQTVTLTADWQKFVINDSVPSVSGKVLGGCGNDSLFLQVAYPLGAICNIDYTKPCVYLGNISPDEDYHTYDMIDAVINAPRTGYITTGFDSSSPGGYVAMNDGTIGSASSSATTRANVDTFPLYNLLWNNVSDTWAPVTGGRGANAIADFTANKALALTKQLGRVISTAGQGSGLTNWALGQITGEETHILTIPEIPGHTHTPSFGGAFVTDQGGSPNVGFGNISTGRTTGSTSSTGGGGAHNTIQPTVFMNVFIKL